jgi:hypothetical protein
MFNWLLESFAAALMLLAILLVAEAIRQTINSIRYPPDRSDEAQALLTEYMDRTLGEVTASLEDGVDAIWLAVDDLMPNIRTATLEQVAINREAGRDT